MKTKRAAPAVVRTPTKDPVKQAVREKAQKAAQKTKEKQNVKKKTEAGAGNMSTLSCSMEMNEIIQWIESKPQLQSWLAGILRNGLLEADYNAFIAGKKEKVQNDRAGCAVLGEKGTTWKALRADGSKVLLSKLLNIDGIVDWFKGDAKLDGLAAVLAAQKLLGVRGNTPVPIGNPCGHRLVPLLWLCKRRLNQLGDLEGAWKNVTKNTLLDLLKWFILERGSGGWHLYLQTPCGGKVELRAKGVCWADAADW